MAVSSTKKLNNEMLSFEKESAVIINPLNYYIIKIEFKGLKLSEETDIDIENAAQRALISEPLPLVVYYSSYVILMVFSCKENETDIHQQDGITDLIISKYVYFFSKNLPRADNIFVRIIKFESPIQIVTYISWIIFQTSHKTMVDLSDNEITQKELQFRTESELKLILENKNIIWDSINSNVKYGVVLRINRKKDVYKSSKDNSKSDSIRNIIKLSEPFDFRDNKKYLKFIFS
jgi:hypothetical protein